MEKETKTVEPVTEQLQEQTPTEGQGQGAADMMVDSQTDKPSLKGPKESIIPTVQKPQVDPNKTEGGVLLDTILSNVYAAYQRRKQVQKEQAQDKFNNPDKNISAEDFKQLMRQLEQEGVDLNKLHKNGDMDRLLQGRMTKELYTRTPQGSWIERSGALFIGDDKQIHQALIKQDSSMEKDLTATQNEQLKKKGELLKGDTLIKRNPKTKRVQRIPASQAARKRHQQQISRKHHPVKKMMKRGI